MTRRWRIRLVWLSVILGVPAAVACVAVSLLWTGQLERLIAAQYRAVMPGDLSIGAVVVTGADEVELRDVTVRDGLHTPLMQVKRAWVRLDMVRGAPLAIRAEGVTGTLDRQNLELLNAITEATGRLPPSEPALEFTLTSDCSVDLPQGLTIRDAKVTGRVNGPLFEVEGAATFDGRQVRVNVWNRLIQGSDQNHRIGVELVDVAGPGKKAVLACTDLGLLPTVPEPVLALVPDLVVVSGSLVTRDVGVLRFGTDADVRWNAQAGRGGGRLRTRLDADAHRIQLSNLRLDDEDLGRLGHTGQGPGSALIDLVKNQFTITGPAVAPGPHLPLPPGLPVDGLVKEAPRLTLRLALDGSGGEVVLAGLEDRRTRAGASWGVKEPLRITATELPLTLCQQLLPPSIVLTGGVASSLAISLDTSNGLGTPRLIEGRATVRQANGTWAGWGAGPLDGELVASPTEGGVRLALTLPQGTIVADGGLSGATLTLDLPRVEDFLDLIHGPMELPRVQGRLGVTLVWKDDGAERRLEVRRLTLDGVALQDRLRALAGRLTGNLRWRTGAPLTIALGGQLTGGQLLLPGGWLDLAARTPIFTVDLDLAAPKEGHPGGIDLRGLLVRAATADGKPAEGGYSAEFRGKIDLDGTGTADGLVDHADLDWINKHATRGGALATGQGAITCTAQLHEGSVQRVEGHFLPLDVDLTVGTRFKASGITGAVTFVLEQRKDTP